METLKTRIPEGRKVRGLEYGRLVTTPGRAYYVVRPARRHGGQWAMAALTPASDELPGTGTDRAIMAAIRNEWMR